MKRIALIAATASCSLAVRAAEFCAEYKAGDAKNAQALKKLGLKQERNWFYNRRSSRGIASETPALNQSQANCSRLFAVW